MPRKKLFAFVISVFILALIFAFQISSGRTVIKESIQVQILENLFKPLDIAFLHLAFVPNRLPTYKIETKADELENLYSSLPEVKDITQTSEERFFQDRLYIPAKIWFDGKEYKAKMTVRGVSPAHFMGEKKSLRVRLEGADTPFEGIDFIVPEDRYFVDERISYEISKRLGLFDLQPGFSWLVLNGKNMGVYQTLPDEQNNSNIELGELSTNDIYYRDESKTQVIAGGASWSDVFSEGSSWQVKNDPEDADPMTYSAIEKFKQVYKLSGKQFYDQFGEIVDLDQYIRYAVHNTLMGDWHQEGFHNQSLLYLKEKGKIWFIPNDNSTNNVDTLIGRHFSPLREKMMANPSYFWARNKYMWHIVNDEEFKKALDKSIVDEYNLVKGPIYQDSLKPFRFLAFRARVKKLRETISDNFETIESYFKPYNIDFSVKNNKGLGNQNLAILKVLTNAYFQPQIESLTFSLSSKSSGSISIYYDENENEQVDPNEEKLTEVNFNDKQKVELPLKVPLKAFRFTESSVDRLRPAAISQLIAVDTSKKLVLEKLKPVVINSLTGETVDISLNMLDGSFFAAKSPLPPFVKQLDKGKFEIGPGEIDIDQDVFIPEGEVKIKPGTVLRLSSKKSIISNASVIAQGTVDEPIKLIAKNVNEKWGSFLIIGKNNNYFDHVSIVNGSGIRNYGYVATGALALHFSDVEIRNSYFASNGDDDGLNIKHGKARLENNVFENNFSDAIDLDAVMGQVSNNEFRSNGGDGIDTSFSKVVISGNRVYGSKDKCISIGEESEVEVIANILNSCDLGMAVKDGAVADLKDNHFVGNRIAVSAYLKKYIYRKGGTVKLGVNQFENNVSKYEIDVFSRLISF